MPNKTEILSKKENKIKNGVKTPEHNPTLQSRNKTNSYRLPLNTNPILFLIITYRPKRQNLFFQLIASPTFELISFFIFCLNRMNRITIK